MWSLVDCGRRAAVLDDPMGWGEGIGWRLARRGELCRCVSRCVALLGRIRRAGRLVWIWI